MLRVVFVVCGRRIFVLGLDGLCKVMNFSFFPQAKNRRFVVSDCSFSLEMVLSNSRQLDSIMIDIRLICYFLHMQGHTYRLRARVGPLLFSTLLSKIVLILYLLLPGDIDSFAILILLPYPIIAPVLLEFD